MDDNRTRFMGISLSTYEAFKSTNPVPSQPLDATTIWALTQAETQTQRDVLPPLLVTLAFVLINGAVLITAVVKLSQAVVEVTPQVTSQRQLAQWIANESR